MELVHPGSDNAKFFFLQDLTNGTVQFLRSCCQNTRSISSLPRVLQQQRHHQENAVCPMDSATEEFSFGRRIFPSSKGETPSNTWFGSGLIPVASRRWVEVVIDSRVATNFACRNFPFGHRTIRVPGCHPHKVAFASPKGRWRSHWFLPVVTGKNENCLWSVPTYQFFIKSDSVVNAFNHCGQWGFSLSPMSTVLMSNRRLGIDSNYSGFSRDVFLIFFY